MLKFEPFLLEDENLLGSCGTGRGFICATDMRLLRVERTLAGRRIRDLSYPEITSISVVDRVNWTTLVVGVVLLALGGWVPRLAPQLLGYIESTRPLRFTSLGEQSLTAIGVLLGVVGIALIVLALARRRCYVELEGPYLLRSGRNRRRWRFPMPTASDARVFAGLVRRQIANRAETSGKKVLRPDAY